MNPRHSRLPRQSNPKKKVLFNYCYNQPGSLPGTIAISQPARSPQINLIDYNQNELIYLNNLTPRECAAYLDTESVSWFDITVLNNESTWQELGRVFNLHPLILEAVVNVPQRPKIEDHSEQLVIITQMANLKPQATGFWLEQVSFVLGKNYLLTVQEEPERDCFDPIRERLNRNRGVIRQRQADYLTYALWDAVIDGYFPVLEAYGEKIELLEDEAIKYPSNRTLAKIHRVRRELLALRRGIWSQRDALNVLIREGHPLVSDRVQPYLKDCYDHTVQIIDMLETYRELASGLMDVYLSAVSNKTNEVMRLLTVISTIFIPLTFIAGVYGMNFNPDASPWNMPELNWYWGYSAFWVVTLAIAFTLVFYFWRKGWLKNVSVIK